MTYVDHNKQKIQGKEKHDMDHRNDEALKSFDKDHFYEYLDELKEDIESMNKPTTEMTLIILPTHQVHELELLKKTDWQYVESITDIAEDADINESMRQIREFYVK